MLEQLGGLNGERYCEVLWRMELIPIPVGGKSAQLISELFEPVRLGHRVGLVHVLKTSSLCHLKNSALGRLPRSAGMKFSCSP
jgi:hypothetical protein